MASNGNIGLKLTTLFTEYPKRTMMPCCMPVESGVRNKGASFQEISRKEKQAGDLKPAACRNHIFEVNERSGVFDPMAISSVGVLSLVTSRLKKRSINQSTMTRNFFSNVGRFSR
jgi:hypothetical protein